MRAIRDRLRVNGSQGASARGQSTNAENELIAGRSQREALLFTYKIN